MLRESLGEQFAAMLKDVFPWRNARPPGGEPGGLLWNVTNGFTF